MKDLLKLSIAEYAADLAAGEYTSETLTRAFLDRIEKCDTEIGAFLTVDPEKALEEARRSDRRRARGQTKGILDGIPYGLKDNFCTRGMRTTCASLMLADFIPPYDAAVVTALREAGCVLLGKLNLDEFAMGSSTETSALGVTRNPHDISRVPGGSSGGSAAAVAAFEAPFSIGSDTGGSVRQPAAFCGVLGLKPTRGVISRYGMISLASSLDCVGIMTKNADDAAIVLSALSEKDGRDATCLGHPARKRLETVKLPERPLRIAIADGFTTQGDLSDEVFAALNRAIACFRAKGAEVVTVSLPSPKEALASYCVLSAAEAASNLARYDGVRFGRSVKGASDLAGLYCDCRSAYFGEEVKRRILFGTYMLSETNRPLYYDGAVAARERITRRLGEILGKCDLLLTPATPTTAFSFGSSMTPSQKRNADLCAVYASLGGLPSLSLPFGTDKNQLPLAVQLTAAPFGEEILLSGAKLLEEAL